MGEKIKQNLCPRIQKKLEQPKEDLKEYIPADVVVNITSYKKFHHPTLEQLKNQLSRVVWNSCITSTTELHKSYQLAGKIIHGLNGATKSKKAAGLGTPNSAAITRSSTTLGPRFVVQYPEAQDVLLCHTKEQI
ncbi:hypothetical protein ACH5RR_025708 [Cinchona calisaya]|uniref:Uncharacterized protein n=1 Tax=Cinchona calisaya TaxID=153742 RepID=A0ABD2Z0F5_9GENT